MADHDPHPLAPAAALGRVPAQGAPAPIGEVDRQAAEELALLRRIADALGSNPNAMVVTDEAVPPGLVADFQLPGLRRLLLGRAPQGGEVAVEEAKFVLVRPANRQRIGGTIVNEGEKPVRLVLAQAEKAAQPALARVYLREQGGSWDFMLGGLLWAGNISAIGVGGASKLAVVEI